MQPHHARLDILQQAGTAHRLGVGGVASVWKPLHVCVCVCRSWRCSRPLRAVAPLNRRRQAAIA
jgi:hypothetical protein